MQKPNQAKETFIYKLKNTDCDLISKLQELTLFLNKKEKVDLVLCELIGKRWSFVVGNDVLGPSKKIRINDNYGLIISQNNDISIDEIKNDFIALL